MLLGDCLGQWFIDEVRGGEVKDINAVKNPSG